MYWLSTSFAQDSKVKKFDFPKYGISLSFPKETVKRFEKDSTAQYSFEIFDTGGSNIGSGSFNLYPYYGNWNEKELIDAVKSEIKSYKLGNSNEILSTERTVVKGIYPLTTIKSIYKFNDKNFTIGREDYVYRTCSGVVHFVFTVPSYNCYLTPNDRAVIVRNYFNWYFPKKKDDNLSITYTAPNGAFYTTTHANKKGISFISCLPDYKSEIDLYKLDEKPTYLSTAADNYFVQVKKNYPGLYNLSEYKPANVTNTYLAKSFNTKINGTEFLHHVYVFKSKSTYFAAVVKSTCADLDGCGPNFIAQVEKLLDTVESIEKKKNEDDDFYEYFGY